jgi:hypothetical protein
MLAHAAYVTSTILQDVAAWLTMSAIGDGLVVVITNIGDLRKESLLRAHAELLVGVKQCGGMIGDTKYCLVAKLDARHVYLRTVLIYKVPVTRLLR